MEQLRQLQISRNTETVGGWSRFAPHRQRITRLLLDAATTTPGSLCVLGAGNCNDLALQDLAAVFPRIELVDIDEQAVTAGIARQGLAGDRVIPHGGIEVTGVAEQMSAWRPDQPAVDEQVDACLRAAEQFRLPLSHCGYAVAASTCLLSQLIGSITLTLGEHHPRFFEMLTCLRREHFRHLVDLTVAGGNIVLITDVVSSLTLPALATATTAELSRIVGQAISQRNFFTGVNPVVLKHLLETDASFATQLTEVRISAPWVWDLGPRLYAVCALTARRV